MKIGKNENALLPLRPRRVAGYCLRKLQAIRFYRKILGFAGHGAKIGIAGQEDLIKVHHWLNPDGKAEVSYRANVTNLVAKMRENVVGFVQLVDRSQEKTSFYSGFWIHALTVKPLYRGMGIGQALVQAVMEKAEKNGAQQLVLQVNRDNHKAIRLYHKLGFKKNGLFLEEVLKKQDRPLDDRYVIMGKIL